MLIHFVCCVCLLRRSARLLFTAGGFVYVATVDVVPSLLQAQTSLQQTLAEVLAFVLGVAMMLVVMAFE